MNKNDLIDTVADKAALSKSDAAKVVDAVLSAITDTLKGGGEVRLSGFGSYHVHNRAASTGRNPLTGAAIQIAASRQIKFKASKTLKDDLNR